LTLDEADAAFTATVLTIFATLTKHYHSGRIPRQEQLCWARRVWISDVPSFASVSGPTPNLGHRRLCITERRIVVCPHRLIPESPPHGVAIVDFTLTVEPAKCRLEARIVKHLGALPPNNPALVASEQ
jgi:hypothetical protein